MAFVLFYFYIGDQLVFVSADGFSAGYTAFVRACDSSAWVSDACVLPGVVADALDAECHEM